MIPKLLHFIWVGDDAKRPDNCMASWRTLHPDWNFILWGNAEFEGLDWVNRRHMTAMYNRELNGVADMMRWEILHAHGGIVVDADSIALRPLDDHLLDCEAFACWENEIARPGLIAAGYFGCVAGNGFVQQIVADIAAEPSVTHDLAWKTVGPLRLTESYRKYRYSRLRIYPSHYFIPRHFLGLAYDGTDAIYADQLWGSTRNTYGEIHKLHVETTPAATPNPKTLPDPDLVQRVAISSDIAGVGRADVFGNLCRGKRVLLLEWPGSDPATTLHPALDLVCATLDATAPDIAALGEVAGRYDVVLAPEVLERVANVSDFLGALATIHAPTFLVSVCDTVGDGDRHVEDAQTIVEIVHPDQKCRYSPYSFANTIRTHGGFKIEQMWFFDTRSMLALLSKTAVPDVA